MEIFKLIGSIFVRTEDAEQAIDETTKKIQNMASTVGGAFTKVGETMSSIGTKLIPVSTGIIGLGAVAVKTSAEVKAMNSQFEQTFGDLQSQASSAMNRVATESGILQTRLQGVGTSIYAFAKSSGADSAEAMELMETALRATADASAYYDRSLEDTSESLMSFLKGNFANDAQLGVSCTETTRNAKAMELFGQKYNDLTEIQKQQTLLKMVTDAQKLSGAMGQASRESDGFENVMGNMKESAKQLGAELGEVLLPTVIDLIQKVTGIIQKFSEMDDGTKKTIITIAGLVACLAPVLIVGGKIISSVGTMITFFPKIVSGVKMVGTGLKALWTIMSANPIGLVITIIGALVAVFIHLWNTSDEFRSFWINLWNNIKTTASNAIDGAKKLISKGIDGIKKLFDFEWGFPKLKMPHFSVIGKFSLNPPSVPKLGLEWYAKGGIMTQPTAFGINPRTGNTMVGGEAGAEAIAPIDTLLNYVRTAVSEENNGIIAVLYQILNKIGDLGGDIVIPVYLGNEIVDEIILNSKNRIALRSGGMVNV